MDSIHNTLFAPFEDVTKYCIWYYALEVYYLIAFVFAILVAAIAGYNKKMGKGYYIALFFGLIFKLLMYAQCRLLYSMCVGI